MRTREEWGGGARPRALTRVGEHPYIEVHHDVYPFEWSGVEHARAIEQQHLAQGWNGAFYNLGIASGGELFELRGRGWQSIGSSWHGKKYRDGTLVDKRAMTVVLFGNFEVSQPAQAQLDTLRSLARTVPDSRLRWHGQRDATACCGRHLIAHLPTLMEERGMSAEAVAAINAHTTWLHNIENQYLKDIEARISQRILDSETRQNAAILAGIGGLLDSWTPEEVEVAITALPDAWLKKIADAVNNEAARRLGLPA